MGFGAGVLGGTIGFGVRVRGRVLVGLLGNGFGMGFSRVSGTSRWVRWTTTCLSLLCSRPSWRPSLLGVLFGVVALLVAPNAEN